MLPNTAHPGFSKLIDAYKCVDNPYPGLKAVTTAQWAVESGWGNSILAQKHGNYAGMKWRKALGDYATPVSYHAWDGETLYCKFKTPEDFIRAYWARFDQIDLYSGWDRAAKKSPEAFIELIGPIWVGGSKSDGLTYIRNIIHIMDTRTFDLFPGE